MSGSCYRPWERCFGGGTSGDGLLWHTDLKPHASGDYSIAVVQANSSLEDQGQVLTSPSLTYVGVYDGHGGPEASRFITNHLFAFLHSNYLSPISSVFFFSLFYVSSCISLVACCREFTGSSSSTFYFILFSLLMIFMNLGDYSDFILRKNEF